MKAISYVGLVLGLALATALVVHAGADTVAGALSRAGWNVGWVALFYLLPMTLAANGWRQLFVDAEPPPLGAAVRAVWIGVAVNWLLPVAQVGGEFVRARLAMKGGVSGAAAGASVVVDKTVQAMNVVIYGLLGLVLFIALTGNMKVLPAVIAFLCVLAVLIFAFYRIQRAGMFGYLAKRLPGLARHKSWEQLVGGAEALDEAIRAVYGHPRRIIVACLFRLMGRLMLAGELWLALYFLGYQASLAEAVMLESL
ncbi:MAG: lysylphosphatidylglycerol synthase domain-containing protein, partial [Alphaproteobacteria bacterium]